MKRIFVFLLGLVALLFVFGVAVASTLVIPAGTKVIEEEAFYGDASIDEVVLPEGIERIKARAVANSGLTRINLPESLKNIADDAFDANVLADVTDGGSMYDWAIENDFVITSMKSTYQVFLDAVSWAQARSKCEAMGGHLATITSAEEQAIIEQLPYSQSRLWMGGFRKGNNSWKWVTGENWDYDNWGEGEPNNSSDGLSDVNGVSIRLTKWNDLNDVNTSEIDGYICEWDNCIGNTHKTTVSGKISSPSGEAVSQIDVYILDSQGSIVGATSTRSNGAWSIGGLQTDEEYTISYSSLEYRVSGNGRSVVLGSYLRGIATLINSGENGNLSFTMRQNDRELQNGDGVKVGTEVLFQVNAPDAETVRLIVDDIGYEEYKLPGTIKRAFNLSKKKARKIQFQIRKKGEYEFTDMTPAQFLYVSCDDGLKKAKINEISPYCLQDQAPLSVSWIPVEHAIGYNIYFYYDGVRYFPQDAGAVSAFSSESEFSYIDEDHPLFAGDKWTVEIVAIGEEGWNSSTSTSNMFTILSTRKEAEIISPSENYEAEVDENVFIGIEEGNSDSDNTLEVYENGVLVSESALIRSNNGYYLKIKAPGNYLIRLLRDNQMLDERHFTAKDPGVVTFYEHGIQPYYTYASELEGTKLDFHVVFNFVPEKVVLCKDGAEIEDSTIINTDRNWEFTFEEVLRLSGPDIDSGYGKYLYSVNAYYGDGGDQDKVQTNEFTVYCISTTDLTGEYRYVSTQYTEIYYRPDENYPKGQLGNKTMVKVMDYCYGDLIEVDWCGMRVFTRLDHLSRYNAGTDGVLSIVSSLDNEDQVIILDEDNKHEGYFDIQTTEQIDSITMFITRISSDHFLAEHPIDFLEENSLLGATYTIDKPFFFHLDYLIDCPGMYRFSIFVHDTEKDIWSLHEEQRYADFYTCIYSANSLTNRTRYLKREESFELYSSPCILANNEKTATVMWNTELTVEGIVDEDLCYVSFVDDEGKKYGFIRTAELSEEMNSISVKRAIVFVSQNIITGEGGKFTNKGLAAYSRMRGLFNSMGCELTPSKGNGERSDLEKQIEYLWETTDFNDLSYIYIMAHGGAKKENIHESDHTFNTIPSYNYTAFASDIKLIKGHVYVIMESCFSGMLMEDIKDDPECQKEIMETNRYTFFASASSTEETPWTSLSTINTLEPPIFTQQFIKYISQNRMLTASALKGLMPTNEIPYNSFTSTTTIDGKTDEPFFPN